jgi:hypothetical protein
MLSELIGDSGQQTWSDPAQLLSVRRLYGGDFDGANEAGRWEAGFAVVFAEWHIAVPGPIVRGRDHDYP